MATTYYNDLQKLYVAYFNRPADKAGLAYWEGVVEAAGGSLAGVTANFAKSKEYTDTVKDLTSTQIITQIYQNLFGHAPDAAGKDYYVKLLDAKTLTVDQIVTEVANGALGTDKTYYNNKVTAAGAFTTALTDAQAALYTGEAANAAAREFVAGVTTDASLATAISTAALAASVAAVVKAGTPFTLANGLDNLDSANTAVASFLDTLDLDKDPTTDTTATQVHQAAATADAAVAAKVQGAYTVGASAGLKAAALADFQAAAAVDGLSAAVSTQTAATDAYTAADKTATAANAALVGAKASYEALHGAVNIGQDGTVANLIVITGGKLALKSGITEANTAGVTALLNSIQGSLTAKAALDTATQAKFVADLDVSLHDLTDTAEINALKALGAGFTIVEPKDADHPTVAEIVAEQAALKSALANAAAGSQAETDAQDAITAFSGKLNAYTAADVNAKADAIVDADTAVKADVKAITDLDKLVSDLATAQANDTALTKLEAAVTAAKAAFETNDFKAPVTLDTGVSFVGATSGADIFVAGTSLTTTITNFGLQGDDVLYVGKGYTFNSGALSAGNDSVLEVFFIQNGANTDVKIETKAFGSHSADPEIVITLTGVNATELTFSNGIITHV